MADGQVQGGAQVPAQSQPPIPPFPVNPGEHTDFLYQQLSHFGTFTGDGKKWHTWIRDFANFWQIIEKRPSSTLQ